MAKQITNDKVEGYKQEDKNDKDNLTFCDHIAWVLSEEEVKSLQIEYIQFI